MQKGAGAEHGGHGHLRMTGKRGDRMIRLLVVFLAVSINVILALGFLAVVAWIIFYLADM